MRLSSLSLACGMLCLTPIGASAYNDVVTHPDISRVSVILSALNLDAELSKRLALARVPFGGTKYVVFRDGEGVPLEDVFAYGAYAEDQGSRAFNHFYDPLFNRPLTVGIALGRTSPAWSLEDEGQIAGQDDSYLDAREAFYQALNTVAGTGQTNYWIRAFESLGHVIHHIQDMAQPQHTRNDQHLDQYSFFGLNPFYNPSRYEYYTADVDVRDKVQGFAVLGQAVYPGSGDFKVPRDFWRNGAGSGMAEFTNRSFVSQGTNFAMLAGQVAMPDYPQPTPGTPFDYKIDDLYSQSGLPVPDGIQALCSLVTIDCRMTMYPAGPSQKASTLSIFDQDLEARAAFVTYTGYRSPTFTTNRLFALNRFNFDDAHLTLIPKAAGYSAGLINYFFRGSFKIEPPALGAYAVADHKSAQGFDKIKAKITNTTPGESMSGGRFIAVARFHTNDCYQADLSGEFSLDASGNLVTPCPNYRSDSESIVTSAEQTLTMAPGESREMTFNFSGQIPMNATDLIIQFVYRGALGSETDGIAVGTADIAEPTFVAVMNGTDTFELQNNFYYYTDIISKISQAPYSAADRDGNGVYNSPPDVNVLGGDIAYAIYLSGGKVADIGALPEGRFARLALLVDQGSFGVDLVATGAGFSGTSHYDFPSKVSQVDFEQGGTFIVSPVGKLRKQTNQWDSVTYYRYYPTATASLDTMPASKAADATTPVAVQLVQ
jgi:hypothetical protein